MLGLGRLVFDGLFWKCFISLFDDFFSKKVVYIFQINYFGIIICFTIDRSYSTSNHQNPGQKLSDLTQIWHGSL